MSEDLLTLVRLPGRYTACRLGPEEPIPAWADRPGPPLVSITRTAEELSIVAEEDRVPAGVTAERGFVAFRVAGTLEFGLIGVLARLTGALAEAGVPVLAISTYDTDVLLVREGDQSSAVAALQRITLID